MFEPAFWQVNTSFDKLDFMCISPSYLLSQFKFSNWKYNHIIDGVRYVVLSIVQQIYCSYLPM